MATQEAMLPVSLLVIVFNEEKYLAKMLESSVAQNIQEIIIGDNHSTDGTQKICEEFAKKYPNIRYIRHDKNLGIYRNFVKVLEKASCDYVSLSGGHDYYVTSSHFKELYTLCRNNPEAAGAYPATKFFDATNDLIETRHYVYAKDYESDDVFTRILSMLLNLRDGTPVYGLYKRENIKEIAITYPNGFTDHAWLGLNLSKGKLLYAPNIFFGRRMLSGRREETVEEKFERYKEIYNTSHFEGFLLQQIMGLVKSLDISTQQKQKLREVGMHYFKQISK